jgi:lipopolysaccharide export system permease protein
MRRLTAYLSRLFVTDALVLFGVVCILLWLVNCLRSFDVVAVKGQSVFTLAVQALYTMPQLGISFFYVCVGIGLTRAMQSLQTNKELHIIHTSYGLGSLWRATAVVTGAGVIAVLFLSNFVEPLANKRLNILNSTVAADLVSSTLKPGRFTQATPGVILLIGGRAEDGEISEFFADDRRDAQTRRTYIAETARVSADGDKFILELQNGSLQNAGSDGRFSEIVFDRYDVGVDKFTQAFASTDRRQQMNSFELVAEAISTGVWDQPLLMMLLNRSAEGLRVIGMCMLVLALMGFPSGKRARVPLPMEAVVLLIAFAERGASAYSPLGTATGALAMIVVAAVILFQRAKPRHIAPAVAA